MKQLDLHLHEEEAVRIADGQPVGAAALRHLDGCDACSQRVADLALASLSVHAELRAVAEAAPSPTKPLVIGTLVALAASIPLMPSAMKTLAALLAGSSVHVEALSSVVRAIVVALQKPGWSFLTTTALVLAGIVAATVATRAAKRRSDEGAVR